MRTLLAGLALIATAACGPRQIDVQTGTPPASEVAVHVTNNLTQPVNFYVVQGGNPMFQKQIAARSTEHVPVRGVSAGSTVTLRAAAADGSRTINSDPIVLSGMYNWTVP